MIKTSIIKVKAITMTKIIIATVIMKIMTIIMKTMRIKIGNRLKYKSVKTE